MVRRGTEGKPRMTTLHVQLEEEMARAVRVRAAERGTKVAAVVRVLLDEWLKKTFKPKRDDA